MAGAHVMEIEVLLNSSEMDTKSIQEENENHIAKPQGNIEYIESNFSMDVVNSNIKSIDMITDEKKLEERKKKIMDYCNRYIAKLEFKIKKCAEKEKSEEEIIQSNKTLKEEKAIQAKHIEMLVVENQKTSLLKQEKDKLEQKFKKVKENNLHLNQEIDIKDDEIRKLEEQNKEQKEAVDKKNDEIRKLKEENKELKKQKEEGERESRKPPVAEKVQVPDPVRERNLKDIREFEERLEGHKNILDQLEPGSSEFEKLKQKVSHFEQEFIVFKKMKKAKTRKEESEVLVTYDKKSKSADVVDVNNHRKIDLSELDMEDDNNKILPLLPPKPDVPTTAVKKFKCQQCSRSFTTAAGMKSHMESKHQRKGAKKLKCMLCPFSGQSSAVLRHTKSAHTVEKLYKCTICKKEFISSQGFKQHEATHSRTKPGWTMHLNTLPAKDRGHEGLVLGGVEEDHVEQRHSQLRSVVKRRSRTVPCCGGDVT